MNCLCIVQKLIFIIKIIWYIPIKLSIPLEIVDTYNFQEVGNSECGLIYMQEDLFFFLIQHFSRGSITN